MWKPGDIATLRGIYNRRVWYIQSTVVVKDTPEEVALALLPGAECFASAGYLRGKHSAKGEWDRWGEYIDDNWKLQRYSWRTNRLLILLEPGKYYSSIYFWQAEINQFSCYYINFQLPYRRSETGFDTFDLELDIVIEPTYEWYWKDLTGYQEGIDRGIILKEWTKEIDCARQEIFEKLKQHQYPLDGKWLDWEPDPNWPTPKLPENWSKV